MDAVEQTGAEMIVAPNPGCMLQLGAGIRARGAHVEVHHLIDLLDRAYAAADAAAKPAAPAS